MDRSVQQPLSSATDVRVALEVLCNRDNRLTAFSSRHWRFPKHAVERAGQDASVLCSGIDALCDPGILPETVTELRIAVQQRIVRPLTQMEASQPLGSISEALVISGRDVTPETPDEADFLSRWYRNHV